MSIIALASNTLAGSPGSGQIEYNGQFYATDSNSARGQLERITQGTAVSASGTSVDFTGIPAWAKKITVMFNGVSLNGTSHVLVQLGDSGGIETTGYLAGCGTTSSSTGFILLLNLASRTGSGAFTIYLIDQSTNSWCGNGGFWQTASADFAAGGKSLTSTLDRVRITTVNGTDTFDAGTINVMWEG